MRHMTILCATLADIALASAVGADGAPAIKSALHLIALRSRQIAGRFHQALA